MYSFPTFFPSFFPLQIPGSSSRWATCPADEPQTTARQSRETLEAPPRQDECRQWSGRGREGDPGVSAVCTAACLWSAVLGRGKERVRGRDWSRECLEGRHLMATTHSGGAPSSTSQFVSDDSLPANRRLSSLVRRGGTGTKSVCPTESVRGSRAFFSLPMFAP